MECPLCDLSKQEVIYQDDYCFSIIISEPLKAGHLMVLPKRHIISLMDLNAEEAAAIANILGRLAKVFIESSDDDPIIFMNQGKHSTQPHIHFHILPSKGGLRHLFSKYEKIPFRRKANPEELKLSGDKFRSALNKMEVE